MDIKPLLASALLSATASFAAPPPTFALIKLDGNSHALLASATRLDPKTTIHLQFPDAKFQPQCCKRLRASEFKLSDDEIVASYSRSTESETVGWGEVGRSCTAKV